MADIPPDDPFTVALLAQVDADSSGNARLAAVENAAAADRQRSIAQAKVRRATEAVASGSRVGDAQALSRLRGEEQVALKQEHQADACAVEANNAASQAVAAEQAAKLAADEAWANVPSSSDDLHGTESDAQSSVPQEPSDDDDEWLPP
jgi:hypothetical protein